MRTKPISMFLASIGAASIAATPVLAQSARDLRDLVGARGSSGENALKDRGFVFITGHDDGRSTSHTYWWNPRSKKCVHVQTRDGRYAEITDTSNGDCNQKGGSDAGAAVAAVAGTALLVALLSHKSGHHDDNKHLSNQADDDAYERGFRDGSYNTPYHNPDRSKAYSDGYESGVEQRGRDTSYHQGRGGYAATARFDDLNGARAAGADSTLASRGFRAVDSFTSGNSRYTIYYRRESRQCLQATIADGRVYDIRDIETNPHCR